MVDQTRLYQLRAPEVEVDDERLNDHRAAPYALENTVQTGYPSDSMPAFHSDRDDEPDPSEFISPVQKRRRSFNLSRILVGISVTAATAILLAVLFSGAARDVIANAKNSSAAVLSAASAAVQPKPKQLTAQQDPALSTDPLALSASEKLGLRSVTTAAVAPTREDIKTALQNAQQSDAPQPAAVTEPIPGDAIHHLDPDEIASAIGRGNALIASGDLAAARLVLRRVANAGDARAAFTLARTYDPVVLEKLGVHGFVPDIAMARVWYEKAKTLGSAEAPERIEMLASKRQ